MQDQYRQLSEPTIGRIVFELNNYLVQIISINDPETKQSLTVYGVINKDTGVREAELRGFIPAVGLCSQIQKGSDEMREKLNKTEELEQQLRAALEPPPAQVIAVAEGIPSQETVTVT